MQIWFSCLYDSDLRKIDAQIRSNKSSLGIFSSWRKGGFMEVRKEDQRDQDEKVVEIEIERLRDFKNHPFKVQADSQMKKLQESIKKYGILNPLIVRPRPEGFYEIISGHRRKYAAQQLKYTKVPVIIRYMLDEDAIISMIDANLQRERISPSEKAFAYKMKYDVLKRKAGRRKCSQVDYLTGKKSVEVISEECGDSPKQVQRYLKLAKLIPELLEKVDDGTMGFTIAVELASLTEKNQRTVLDAMESTLGTPNLSQAIRIKKLQEGGVGKTVSCVNLGIGLAQEGKKVLLIDADPQGSLTISLGYEEPDEMEYSLATLMLNVVNDEKLNMEKTILHHGEGVDLIPANIELSAIEK